VLASQPEFESGQRLRGLIELTERRELLAEVLTRRSRVTRAAISIGSENEAPELTGFTLVTGEYRVGDLAGVIGVIGPTRMPYDRVVTIVESTSRIVSELYSGRPDRNAARRHKGLNHEGMRDYYEILGVDRNADTDRIKKAYRKLALEYHPDRNGGSQESEERFREATEAYEVLRDPQKRTMYDRYGHAGVKGGAAGPGSAGSTSPTRWRSSCATSAGSVSKTCSVAGGRWSSELGVRGRARTSGCACR
jgi:hypothetical protein